MNDDTYIVDEIPALHPAYAALGPNGYWFYWEKTEDGKFKWNPRWVVTDVEHWKKTLADVKEKLEKLEKEEMETPEEARTTEWYQIISARKRDLIEDIRYYEFKAGVG